MGRFIIIILIVAIAYAVYKYAMKSAPKVSATDSKPESGADDEQTTYYRYGADSIIDLIDLDLEGLPDDVCELEAESEEKECYHRILSQKIFGIFDKVKIIVTSGGTMNFIFMADKDNVTIEDLRKIINTFYVMYGEDDMGNGVFSQKDIDEYNYENPIWDRRWSHAKVAAAVYAEEYGVNMTVWSHIFSQKQKKGVKIFQIKGTNYRKYTIEPGMYLARLVPEDNNQYDEFAVQVVSKDGILLGYVPAGNEHLFSTLKDNNDTESLPVVAVISKGFRGNHIVLNGMARMDTTQIKNLDINKLIGI